MNVIGLDIGTTTLSAVAVDSDTGALLETLSIPNGADLPARMPGSRTQDPDRIAERALGLVDALKSRHEIAAIGIDGQMHGVLYTDGRGRAVSPLFTWQDQRGAAKLEDATYAEVLSRRTGRRVAAGYGMVTHFWHVVNKCVPEGAKKLCTVYDYVGMKLTGRAEPLMHISTAASLGLVNAGLDAWDLDAMASAGIDAAILPELSGDCVLIGETPEGIPAACGIGDNQASFIGSVRDMGNTVLVNMGTGGQVSMLASGQTSTGELEVRPLGGGQAIVVGSVLCGGRSYALLERFLRSCAQLAGAGDAPLYEAMNRIALEMLDDDALPVVDTRFSGTRALPEIRGSICGIGVDNFDAGRLIAGTILGMTREIHQLYRLMLTGNTLPATFLAGSGNAIRRNPALKKAFEKAFGMAMQIPEHKEEAAYGSALFAMASAGIKASLANAQQLIQYERPGGRK